MKICFIVDYRSPIARNWINYFIGTSHEVHVISTFAVSPAPVGLASFHVVPVGFSSISTGALRRYVAVSGAGNHAAGNDRHSPLSSVAPALNAVARRALTWIQPVDAWRRRHATREIIESIQPDLVHAMRIPFEGMLAAEAMQGLPLPLLISVWGNDFTLWARDNPLIAVTTSRAMHRTNALHTDCRRDLRLAYEHGFTRDKPNVVIPGSGGVQLEMFHQGPVSAESYAEWGLSPDRPVVFNPRNFRVYVRNDTFFLAVERLLAKRPDVQVLCVGMAGNPIAERWRSDLKDPASVRLLPSMTRAQMAELFRIADISVSPSTHDGTPNTLLEAMACGAYPVVGDVESIREWIDEGVNGSFCDANDPESVAAAILRGLDPDARARAAVYNRRLIEERADFRKVMPEAERFYQRLIATVPVSHAAAGSMAHRGSPTGVRSIS